MTERGNAAKTIVASIIFSTYCTFPFKVLYNPNHKARIILYPYCPLDVKTIPEFYSKVLGNPSVRPTSCGSKEPLISASSVAPLCCWPPHSCWEEGNNIKSKFPMRVIKECGFNTVSQTRRKWAAGMWSIFHTAAFLCTSEARFPHLCVCWTKAWKSRVEGKNYTF